MANCNHSLFRQCTGCDSRVCMVCEQSPACPECGKMGTFKMAMGSASSGSLFKTTGPSKVTGTPTRT